ncbi:MAG: hypothetical protein HN627_09320 [Opitutae bacterium]|nr:hypothetical protein [Opitutae bacterium]
MAVLLQFDYNKRLGLPAFSSHSFGITMRAEVTDPEKIGEEAERAYGLLQSAVDSQIVHQGYVSNEDKGENGTDQVQKTQGKVNGNVCKTDPDKWNCTIRQRGLIVSVIERNGLDLQVVEDLSQELHGRPMSDLGKAQVSAVITEVLDRWGRHPKANGTKR